MTSEKQERYRALLAAYGSDVARWPATALKERDHASFEMSMEAQSEYSALDRLLANAGRDADALPPPNELMTRILSAATQDSLERQGGSNTSTVVPLSSAKAGASARGGPAVIKKQEWTAAAALMAASLLIGIFLGSQETVQSTAARMGNLAGFNLGTQSVQTSALDDALQIQDDEEIL